MPLQRASRKFFEEQAHTDRLWFDFGFGRSKPFSHNAWFKKIQVRSARLEWRICTASIIGLSVPPTMLVRADEVIE